MPRILSALLVCLALLAGCGAGDAVDRVRTQAEDLRGEVQQRIDRARDEFEARRERFGERIREVLADLEKVTEQPARTSPVVRSRGSNEPETIDVFLTRILRDVDRYWTRTFAASDLPAPQVRYDWIAPGARVLTSCGTPAGDGDAFYCPADDTIYVGQQFAADLYRGVLANLPGDGRAGGDFAVAYVVAHEYAHNLQQELGLFDNRETPTARPFELQADCLAGVWAHSVYAAGTLQPDDLQEAADTALAVGDFDVGNAQHHGTPTERRDALLLGFRDGEPASCTRYLPVG
jgi:predicted metalloprotease